MTVLERLREQYYYLNYFKLDFENTKYRRTRYDAMKELCLDCSLLSSAEINQMEKTEDEISETIEE